jgi:hypothetical protein
MEVSTLMAQLQKNITSLLGYRQISGAVKEEHLKPQSKQQFAEFNKKFDSILDKFASIQAELEKVKTMPQTIETVKKTQAEILAFVKEIDSYLERVSADENREEVLKAITQLRANKEKFLELNQQMNLILQQLEGATKNFIAAVETPLKIMNTVTERFDEKNILTKTETTGDRSMEIPKWVLLIFAPLVFIVHSCIELIESATKIFASCCVSLLEKAKSCVQESVSLFVETRKLFDILDVLLPLRRLSM